MTEKFSGTFSGTGQSSSSGLFGYFNLSLSGFGTATVQLQRSYDQGVTWKTRTSYTADTEAVIQEPEYGVLYRLNCSAYTSGTIAYRVGAN